MLWNFHNNKNANQKYYTLIFFVNIKLKWMSWECFVAIKAVIQYFRPSLRWERRYGSTILGDIIICQKLLLPIRSHALSASASSSPQITNDIYHKESKYIGALNYRAWQLYVTLKKKEDKQDCYIGLFQYIPPDIICTSPKTLEDS